MNFEILEVNYLIDAIDTVELVGYWPTISGLVQSVIWLFRTMSDYNRFRDYSTGVTNVGVNANHGLSRQSFVRKDPNIMFRLCFAVDRSIADARETISRTIVASVLARNN